MVTSVPVFNLILSPSLLSNFPFGWRKPKLFVDVRAWTVIVNVLLDDRLPFSPAIVADMSKLYDPADEGDPEKLPDESDEIPLLFVELYETDSVEDADTLMLEMLCPWLTVPRDVPVFQDGAPATNTENVLGVEYTLPPLVRFATMTNVCVPVEKLLTVSVAVLPEMDTFAAEVE